MTISRMPAGPSCAWQTRTRASISPSVNATLSAIRAVAEACFNLERMSADDFGRIKNVKMMRGSRDLAGREIMLGEIDALVRVCQAHEGPAGIRDIVIIGLLYICGLRRAEVASLNVESYNVDDGIIKSSAKATRSALYSRTPARAMRSRIGLTYADTLTAPSSSPCLRTDRYDTTMGA